MKDRQYSGYQPYQYLEAGKDYKEFSMADEVNRVEPYKVPLSDEKEEIYQEIASDSTFISLHEHPVIFPDDMEEIFEFNREGREFTAYEGLSQSCLDAVFDNMMDGTSTITSKMGWKWRDIIYDLGMRLSDIAHQDFIIKCEGIDDIRRAHEEGKIALVFSLESATMIENEVDRLDILYGLGVRSMGVVYSESNALGSGLREPRDGGLTVFGHQAVDRMNKLGIAIDVSHAGDQTSLDTIKASDKPVMITHTGARSLWQSSRMKPDDVLKACAENGGVIGIEAAPHTTITENNPKHSIESYMEHFEYCVDLLGIDHVSFGPDTLFGDHVTLHDVFREHLSVDQAFTREDESGESEEPEHVPYVKGMENPSEASHNIIRWLVKHDYSREEIEKVIGGNTLRVLEEVWE